MTVQNTRAFLEQARRTERTYAFINVDGTIKKAQSPIKVTYVIGHGDVLVVNFRDVGGGVLGISISPTARVEDVSGAQHASLCIRNK